MGKDNENVRNWCDELENGDKLKGIGIVQVARELNGFKTRLASSLTAAYGGVYNLSPYNYKNLNDSARLFGYSIDVSDAEDRGGRSSTKFVTKWNLEATELLARLGLGRLMDEAIGTNRTLQFPWPPTDPEFESYVKYLEDIRTRTIHIAKFFDDLRSITAKSKSDTETWEGYLKKLQGIEHDLQKQRFWRAAGNYLIPGAVTLLVSALLSQIVPVVLAGIIGIGPGAVMAGARSAKKDRGKAKSESRYNLIATWDELKELSPR